MPVYLYWGEEEFNLENAVKELRNKIINADFAAMSHRKLDDPDIIPLIEAVQSLPMMFGEMLIEVNALSYFTRGAKKTFPDDLTKKLMEALEHVNEKVHVLFVCKIQRDSGKKIDSTKKLTKLVQKIGKVQEFPAFKFYEDAKVVDWIIKQAKTKKLKMSSAAAEIMLANAGSDLRKLDIELDKIRVMIYPETAIIPEHLKELADTSENIFKLADLWIKGEKSFALKELHKLFEKNHPLKILATLQTMSRRWLKVKVMSENSNAFNISKQVNLPSFVVEQDIKKLKNVSEEKLVLLRKKAVETEYKIKTGELSAENAMELLILS